MQNQKITIDVIETKEFTVVNRGYNQHEVDEFLDSICDEMERAEAETAALKQRIDELEHPVEPKPGIVPRPVEPVAPAGADGTFKEILEMALRVKDQTIADAREKAAEIIANAEIEVKARMGSINAEKEAMEAELEAMKAAAQEYKAKFAELLAMAHDALDAADVL